MTQPGAVAPSRRVRTVFFGTGAFAVPILEAVASAGASEIVLVVTAPDRPAGRHARVQAPPVAGAAVRLGLPRLAVARVRAADAIEAIAARRPELGLLADFGQLVPPALLDLPGHGILNVHPSLLPRHRGATPIPATILAGDPEAGVSVMAMDAGLDTGPVLARRAWPLDGSESTPELESRAAVEGAALLLSVLPAYLAGALRGAPQDDALATATRPLRRDDGRLDPVRPAAELERRVRAFRPWPGTFLETAGGRVAVLRADVAPSAVGDRPGELVADDGGLAFATIDGRLRLVEVQPAGGRPMSSAAFLRGHPAALGPLARPADRAARAPS